MSRLTRMPRTLPALVALAASTALAALAGSAAEARAQDCACDTTTAPPPDTGSPGGTAVTSLPPIPSYPGCGGWSGVRRTITATPSTGASIINGLTDADSGTLVILPNGTYAPWNQDANGTKTARIRICAQNNHGAIVRNTSITSGNTCIVSGDWTTVRGVVCRRGRTGLAGWTARGVSIQYVLVDSTGEAGMSARTNAFAWEFLYDSVRVTGRYRPAYGEGVYVGNKEDYDGSDSVRIRRNVFGPYVTAQHVDLKRQRWARVDSNVFNGAGQDTLNWTRGPVFTGGSDGLFFDNVGSDAPRSMVDIAKPVVAASGRWSERNVFRGNRFDVNNRFTPAYGFFISGGANAAAPNQNVIYCAPSNAVTDAASGFSNVPCTP